MKLFLFILTLSLSFGFTGCKSAKVTQIPVRTVERVTERLVPIEVPGDSAVLVALFECDSLNRVLLKDFKDFKGRAVGTKLQFKDGKLDYRADFKPETVYLPSKTVEIEKEVPVMVEVPKVEYRQTKMQRVFFYIGLVSVVMAAVWLGVKIKTGNLLNIILKLFK